MRRFLVLLAVGMVVVALWSTDKSIPDPPRPFFQALDVDGRTLLIETVLARGFDEPTHFTVGGVEDAEPTRLAPVAPATRPPEPPPSA